MEAIAVTKYMEKTILNYSNKDYSKVSGLVITSSNFVRWIDNTLKSDISLTFSWDDACSGSYLPCSLACCPSAGFRKTGSQNDTGCSWWQSRLGWPFSPSKCAGKHVSMVHLVSESIWKTNRHSIHQFQTFGGRRSGKAYPFDKRMKCRHVGSWGVRDPQGDCDSSWNNVSRRYLRPGGGEF